MCRKRVPLAHPTFRAASAPVFRRISRPPGFPMQNPGPPWCATCCRRGAHQWQPRRCCRSAARLPVGSRAPSTLLRGCSRASSWHGGLLTWTTSCAATSSPVPCDDIICFVIVEIYSVSCRLQNVRSVLWRRPHEGRISRRQARVVHHLLARVVHDPSWTVARRRRRRHAGRISRWRTMAGRWLQ